MRGLLLAWCASAALGAPAEETADGVSRTVAKFEAAYRAKLRPELHTPNLGEFTEKGGKTSIDAVLERRGLVGPRRPEATIMMSFDEAHVLLDALRGARVTRYLEWGSGGSTELVSWLLLSRQLAHRSFRAFSVESSAEWIAVLRNRSQLIDRAAADGGLSFLHGDIGPTGALGFPRSWPLALPTALRFVSPATIPAHRQVDVALVDGRFRVACAYSAALHLAPNATLLMHDFGPPMMKSRRHEYEALLREGHFELVGLVRSLATLRLRHERPLAPHVAERLRARRDHWAMRSAA